jgi:hypothetical protein
MRVTASSDGPVTISEDVQVTLAGVSPVTAPGCTRIGRGDVTISRRKP